mmetsp:Transcript_6045/g.6742  ORF Transcript_6045/g.6742 Transcript_6045/m.6742 type:complete len:316 (-) Transcript_6045:835-1782(-)
MMLFKELGSVWSEIAKFLPGRSENMVKNRYYSCLKKKFGDMTKEQIAQHIQLEKVEEGVKTKKQSNISDFGSTESGSTCSADLIGGLSSASGMSPRSADVGEFKSVDRFFEDFNDDEPQQREFSGNLMDKTRAAGHSGTFDDLCLGMTSAGMNDNENMDFQQNVMMTDMSAYGQPCNSAFLNPGLPAPGFNATGSVMGHECVCPDMSRVDFTGGFNLDDSERIDSAFFKEREFVYDFDNRSRGNSLRNTSAAMSGASYRSDSNASAMTDLSRISQLLADDESDKSSKIEQLNSLRDQLTNLSDLVSEKLGELQTA